MTLGLAQRQGDLLDEVTRFCEEALPEASVYGLLHRERDQLFPDELFADLFAGRGRRCVPPSVVATVMVLQRLEGLSDREAVERYTFDARWRYAAGVGGYGSGGWGRFAHTVLVDMRERLRRSDRPDRVFEVALAAARQAGLVGRRRVLDSTPLYDAVATMDTVTLIGSALRGLLAVADQVLEAKLRAVLGSSDDYASAAKPQIDWDDPAAREALVDSRATDARACLAVLDGCQLDPVVAQAAVLGATVVGQDLEEGEDGRFRIARKVAADRVISTVDPDARHGHKSSARGFDGYKGHALVDPDSELICATAATAGNVGDAAAAPGLLAELVAQAEGDPPASAVASVADPGPPAPTPTAYGDSAYGTGPLLVSLHAAGIDPRVKVQAPVAPGGHFTKDQFQIDLTAGTVTCPPSAPPRSSTAPIRATATTVRPASARPARAARWRAGAPRRPAGAPSPSPPTRPSWPLRAPARPTPTWPLTTARPDPRWNASSPIWSAAAMAAAVCGPRSGQGRRRLQPAGRRGQPGPAGRAGPALDRIARLGSGMSRPACHTSNRAAWLPARHPARPANRRRAPRQCSRQHARPLRSLIPMTRFTPAT
jgi:hypothetical protein